MNVLQKWSAYLYKRYGYAKRKGDHRGLTFVELICAMAILGLVGASVSGIMIVGANSYRRGTTEVELQTEAQLAANQIGDLIIDTTAEVTGADDPAAAHTITVDCANKRYVVAHDAGAAQLLYSEYDLLADGGSVAVSEGELLAENVTKFAADVSDFSSSGSIRLSMTLEKDTKAYTAYFTITARNGHYEVTEDGLVTAATVVAPNEIVVEPNQKIALNATVVGGITDKSVTWTLANNSDIGTQIIYEDGVPYLNVARGEKSDSMVLTVSTAALNGADPLAFATVQVRLRRVDEVKLNGVLTAGAALKQNATYRVNAVIGGTSLARLLGSESDMDYVSPYELSWSYELYDKNGARITTNTNSYFSWDEHGTYADIKLNTDFKNEDNNYKLIVYARALHPDGNVGGVKTNKSGLSYVDDPIIGKWVLNPGLSITVKGGWLRGGESPMLVEGLDTTGAREDGHGNVYVTYGLEWEIMEVPGGVYRHLTSQSNAGGFGGNGELPDGRVLMDTWGGIRSTYTPGKPDDLTEGLLTNFYSYSTPYYNPQDMQTPYSVYKLRLTLTVTDVANVQTATAEFEIPDATISYRNSNPNDPDGAWSNDKGSHIIYVTDQDSIDTYTSYFMIVDGWATEGETYVRGDGTIDWDNPINYNDYVLYNRFVGVIRDDPGYENDARYDLTFVDANGLMYKNGLVPYHQGYWDGNLNQMVSSSLYNRLIVIQKEKMTKDQLLANLTSWSNVAADPTDMTYQWSHWIESQLNLNEITSGKGGLCTLSVYVTQSEKDMLCANGGTTIKEIYEYNPQFCSNNLYEYMSDAQKARAETVDGCQGYLEYRFRESNIELSAGSVKPKVMYCPVEGDNALVNGFYYIDEDTRYQVTGNTAYYQVKTGGVFTNQLTLTWNGSKWSN